MSNHEHRPTSNGHDHGSDKGGHHELSPAIALKIGATLIFLTGVTIWTARFDLGWFNTPLAMFIATTKALLVVGFFMNLFYDKRELAGIFSTSFVFLTIFVTFCWIDLFFRGDVYVTRAELVAKMSAASAKAGPKFAKAWVATPALVEHGKALYAQNCATCHGNTGHGDGVGGAALVPKPRNFASAEGWKNGRKPSQVFKTLKEGIKNSGMASYEALPPDDRWALSHYVLTLGAPAPADTPADLAAVGVDPSKDGMEVKAAPSIPIELAMRRLAEPEIAVAQAAPPSVVERGHPGAQLWQAHCVQCHGPSGEGARAQNMGVWPKSFVQVGPIGQYEGFRELDRFTRVVTRGLPGNLMPGQGQLSGEQVRDLYSYVRELGR